MIDDLRSCYLFADLSEAQVQRIAKNAVRVRLKEGDALFEQGDPAKRFYLVLSGQIKLYRLSPAGNEKVIDIVTPGSTFAEALMFLERPHYPVGAQALQPSEVVSIDAADFADMLRGSVETCFVMLGVMSQRLRGLLREIDELSLHSATCRVAAYLVKHAPAQSDSFELPVAKQIVASRLSVKPETFSRIIKNLIDAGVISVRGSRVTILDRGALQEAADTCAIPLEAF
jgi:CRP-like cAMP-binding protein